MQDKTKIFIKDLKEAGYSSGEIIVLCMAKFKNGYYDAKFENEILEELKK